MRAFWISLTTLFLGSNGALAYNLAVVVDRSNEKSQKVVEWVRSGAGPEHSVIVHEAGRINFGDPQAKGRFLAKIATADLVIPVGSDVTHRITGELEENVIFFLGASILQGETLLSKRVGGFFSYSPPDLAQLAKALASEGRGLALLFTPGYEPVAREIEKRAADLNIRVSKESVRSRREIAPAARRLLKKSSALWVAGDPLLSGGLAFDYLVGEALSARVGLLTVQKEQVLRGALAAHAADPASTMDQAAVALKSLLEQTLNYGAERFFYPDSGRFHVNATVAEKLRLSIPDRFNPLWIK